MSLEILPVLGLPAIVPGADLGALVYAATTLLPGDVLVVASTVVAKAGGRRVDLADVEVSERAQALAAQVDKDPRLVELILRESTQVSRAVPGVLIVRHRLGLVSANAGIDRSNVGAEDHVLLLPEDPDGSARELSAKLGCAVVVSDSLGRPFRVGTTGAAIGVAGLPAVLDRRGATDLDGRVLEHTVVGLADQIAAAAELVMGQADEGIPAAIVRGLDLPWTDSSASELCRDADKDLYL